MLRPNEAKERGELLRRLKCWRESVELHARGMRGDPQMYAALHSDLLQCCRGLAAGCEEEHKTLYEDMVKLVQPWLSTEALIQARRSILVEVLDRCRQAERELGGRSRWEWCRRWLPSLQRILIAGLALGVLVWATLRWWLPLKSTVKGARVQMTMALERLGVAERWMLGGTIAVVIAMFLLSRTAKS